MTYTTYKTSTTYTTYGIIAVLAALAAAVIATPVRAVPTVQSCQTPTGSDTSAAYLDGYTYGCFLGLTHYGASDEADTECLGAKAPTAYTGFSAGRWSNGCFKGFDDHVPIQQNNLTIVAATVQTAENRCSDVQLGACVRGFLGRISDLTREEACTYIPNESCFVGYSRAQGDYFSNQPSTRYPNPTIDQATIDASAALDNCNLVDTLAAGGITSQAFINGYKKGCPIGYRYGYETEHVTEDVRIPAQGTYCKSLANPDTYTSPNTNLLDFEVGTVAGCRNGIVRAWYYRPAPVPSAATLQRAQELNYCGLTSASPNDDYRNGRAAGCVDGFNQSRSDESFSRASCQIGHPTAEPYEFYLHFQDYNKGYVEACIAAADIHEQEEEDEEKNVGNNTGSGIIPACNPALQPGTPYGPDDPPSKIPCGVNKFVELLQNIIKYLSLVVIPIAVLLIGWAGFTIMTAAGSEEKVNKGKKMIMTVVIGLVIIALSYLIIKFVFDALGVQSGFRGKLFSATSSQWSMI